jgi:hypothetical protein
MWIPCEKGSWDIVNGNLPTRPVDRLMLQNIVEYLVNSVKVLHPLNGCYIGFGRHHKIIFVDVDSLRNGVMGQRQ